MDDFQSMPLLLMKVKETETQSEKSRKLLNVVCAEVFQVKDEIKELSKRLMDAKVNSSNSYDYLQLQKYEWENAVSYKNILNKALPEKQQVLENKKVQLEEIQNTVWQERQHFCDHVLRFSEKYGVLATLEQPQVKTQVKLEKTSNKTTITEITKEIIELKKEHQYMKLKLMACNTQVGAHNQELCDLMNEHTTEQEIARLDEAMTFTEQECKMARTEISNLQSLLEKKACAQIPNLFLGKTGKNCIYSAQPQDCKTVLPYNKLTATMQKIDTILTSNYDNKAVENASYTQTQQGFAPQQPRQNNAIVNESSSQNISIKITSPKKCVNNKKDKKKTFIPKTPSTFSRKLKSSKEGYSNLENEMLAILASPKLKSTKVNAEKYMATSYAIETSNSRKGVNQQQLPNENMQFTSIQKHKPKELEDSDHSSNYLQSMFTPYVT